MPDARPLLVFSDDWGRHPSSSQHLVRRLLPTRPVVWVNTIGTRPPGLNWSTVTRGAEKVRQWVLGEPNPPAPFPGRGGGEGGRESLPAAELSDATCSPPLPGEGLGERLREPNPLVLNPKMWPSFRTRLARALNRRLIARAVAAALRRFPDTPTVVTTLPVVADLVGAFPAARWVYYCVDDFAAWPGLDGRTLQRMERELVAKVDGCVAVSEHLQHHLAALGKSSVLLTHGVDLGHWQQPPPAELPPSLRDLDTIPGPLVVFWGVIDRRTDTAFVRAVSDRMAAGTVLLVGPQDDPDPEVLRLPRVRTLPPVPYTDLPALAARAAVLAMPYADLPVTRAMQPLKLKEYLATGKPVVASALPSTRPWADAMDVAATAGDFAAAVAARLASGLPPEQASARGRLDAEGWDAKAGAFAGQL